MCSFAFNFFFLFGVLFRDPFRGFSHFEVEFAGAELRSRFFHGRCIDSDFGLRLTEDDLLREGEALRGRRLAGAFPQVCDLDRLLLLSLFALHQAVGSKRGRGDLPRLTEGLLLLPARRTDGLLLLPRRTEGLLLFLPVSDFVFRQLGLLYELPLLDLEALLLLRLE